jgi:hypothetical protein
MEPCDENCPPIESVLVIYHLSNPSCQPTRSKLCSEISNPSGCSRNPGCTLKRFMALSANSTEENIPMNLIFSLNSSSYSCVSKYNFISLFKSPVCPLLDLTKLSSSPSCPAALSVLLIQKTRSKIFSLFTNPRTFLYPAWLVT